MSALEGLIDRAFHTLAGDDTRAQASVEKSGLYGGVVARLFNDNENFLSSALAG